MCCQLCRIVIKENKINYCFKTISNEKDLETGKGFVLEQGKARKGPR